MTSVAIPSHVGIATGKIRVRLSKNASVTTARRFPRGMRNAERRPKKRFAIVLRAKT
jgi:hypothetical protein